MEKFVVSARKYRPANFNSVVGQAHITDTLRNAIKFGQLSHAYLFTGPRGVGKTTCARIFAKAINCMNPTAESEACGECESCMAFEQGRSFNIHELDAASNNSVDDIRALNEKVRIAPQVGKYSLYIIDEVHMLSTGAFNAFLKTLEEPPHYAIFILATTEKHKILPTILSRCQSYDFKRIRIEDIVQYLKYIAASENVNYDEESLHLIAAKADGGMRDALSMFDRVVSFCGNQLRYDRVAECIGSLDLNTYFEAMDMVVAEDFGSLLMLLDSIINKGFEAGQFVSGLSEHIRNLVVVKNPSTMVLLEVSAAMADRYKVQASKIDIELLLNAMNLINTVDNTYKNATNRRLHTELALVKLCGLKKKDSFVADVYPMPQIVVGKISEENSVGKLVSVQANNREIHQVNQSSLLSVAKDHASEPQPESTQKLQKNNLSEGQNVSDSLQDQSKNKVSDNSSVVQSANPMVEGMHNADKRPNAEALAVNTLSTEVSVPKADRKNEIGDSGRSRTSVSRFSLSSHLSAVDNSIIDDISKNIKSGVSGDDQYSHTMNSNVQSSVNVAAIHTNRNEASINPNDVESFLKKRFVEIIELWKQRHRPRLATVLSENSITGNRIIIKVPDESPAQEIIQNKLQIEMDIRQMLGVVAVIEVEICDVPMKYAPVSVEQKLQHLININPLITKLRDELDLTL